ncbi:hypothetical protein CFOL_v3_04863 [Cephalotus follicularis]|uniref:Uncharacterized protein n=1 Tax=Cephalotus follicularis TaxID=3775 RepID=A0A1Q3B000_CEPFO|nr:hypothetical protein CFOL_v3_04863 [Cephalotus follicularis]
MVVNCFGDFPWRIYASVDGITETLQIESFNNEHTCHVTFKNHRVIAAYLVEFFREKIKAIPKLKSKKLKDLARADLKVEVSISMCKREKKNVVEEMKGNHKEDFARLWSYVAELRNINLGSTIILESERVTPEEGTVFTRFYICFVACKQGWLAGCRPIISLDGCFLKTMYKGELVVAAGRDGNNMMFPIAWQW